MNGKRRWLFTGLLLPVLAITGCSFLRNAEKIATAPDPVVVGSVAEEKEIRHPCSRCRKSSS